EIRPHPPVPVPAKEPAGTLHSSVDILLPRRPNKWRRSDSAVPALPTPAHNWDPAPPTAPASRSLPCSLPHRAITLCCADMRHTLRDFLGCCWLRQLRVQCPAREPVLAALFSPSDSAARSGCLPTN